MPNAFASWTHTAVELPGSSNRSQILRRTIARLRFHAPLFAKSGPSACVVCLAIRFVHGADQTESSAPTRSMQAIAPENHFAMNRASLLFCAHQPKVLLYEAEN